LLFIVTIYACDKNTLLLHKINRARKNNNADKTQRCSDLKYLKKVYVLKFQYERAYKWK